MTTTAIKERPILFSGAMVRALLDGRKTQTRRILKCKDLDFSGAGGKDGPEWNDPAHWGFETESGEWFMLKPSANDYQIPCPYGEVGDQLWVKETWRPEYYGNDGQIKVTYAADGLSLVFDAEDVGDDWKMPKAANKGNVTPLFMPRWASRIRLENELIRAERTRSISAKDILAEGVVLRSHQDQHLGKCPIAAIDGACYPDLISVWGATWIKINGKESWQRNDWTWAISFNHI